MKRILLIIFCLISSVCFAEKKIITDLGELYGTWQLKKNDKNCDEFWKKYNVRFVVSKDKVIRYSDIPGDANEIAVDNPTYIYMDDFDDKWLGPIKVIATLEDGDINEMMETNNFSFIQPVSDDLKSFIEVYGVMYESHSCPMEKIEYTEESPQ
ncbi:hypothetical protein HDR59_00865 [bacterium]|nr:hypothetical protein [bacterium]